MQDSKTGEMIELKTEEAVHEAKKAGFCVLSIGEKVYLKDTDLKVHSFGKKNIVLEILSPIHYFKMGEHIVLKNGSFFVESFGKKFLRLKGLPSVYNVDQALIDQYRKSQVDSLRK